MHQKPTDYYQYIDFLSQYDNLPITPRSPPTPTKPSSPSIHSYSSTLNSELHTTKKELYNCQLFLTEATNNFNFEKRINEDFKKNFTLLDTKYKHDIQTMQTALNAQKC